MKHIYFVLIWIFGPRGLKCLGKGTLFRKPIRLLGRKYISIGSCCDIMNGMRMECVSQWNHQTLIPPPELIIEDYVAIGQNCHFTCARKIVIGEGTSILPEVLITDIKHICEKNKSLWDTGIEVGSVTIGKYVQIGMGARIMANGRDLVIGDNAIIGANSVVTQDVKEGVTVVGIPAREIES